MTDSEHTINQLNHLIGVNKDADAGFHTAAENVNNTEIQTLFVKYAGSHARFGDELASEIERLGGHSSDSGTVAGVVHRGWLDIKAVLTGHSAKSILAACQGGEESAESAYLDAIKMNPKGQTHTILQSHCEQIKGFSTRLRRLVGEMKDGVEFQNNG